ncbi:MAG: xanthine dehydrogenase family protein subunit M [Anderseniella sp.]|nr:xanthine dehydrogenase family protein subunit M [Anderseniella sp.]
MSGYAQPTSLDEAVSLLAGGGWTVLAGGTDVYPALGEDPVTQPLLDVSRIDALRGIHLTPDGAIRIGALATWTDIVRADLPAAFDALKQAAREVGSVQIQNRATLAGNLCNASPAADGMPPLLVLDALVELNRANGKRLVPLKDFIQGNRQTVRADTELVTAIHIPASALDGQSAFFKLGSRRYLVISIAMIAARLAVDENGLVTDAAEAVGACSAVAQRLPKLEAALKGQPAEAAARIATPEHLDVLSPIDDVRAPAAYRLDAALEGVRRVLAAAAGGRLA